MEPLILVRSMGKIFPAKAFPSDGAANSYCERHKDWGVIAVQKDGIVFVAYKYQLKEVASRWLALVFAELEGIE